MCMNLLVPVIELLLCNLTSKLLQTAVKNPWRNQSFLLQKLAWNDITCLSSRVFCSRMKLMLMLQHQGVVTIHNGGGRFTESPRAHSKLSCVTHILFQHQANPLSSKHIFSDLLSPSEPCCSCPEAYSFRTFAAF